MQYFWPEKAVCLLHMYICSKSLHTSFIIEANTMDSDQISEYFEKSKFEFSRFYCKQGWAVVRGARYYRYTSISRFRSPEIRIAYAFDVPVHSTNSVNFRSIVYLLRFEQ